MRASPPKGRKGRQGNWFKHDFAFMQKVVLEYLDGNSSMIEVARRYNINRGNVRNWVDRYNKSIEPFTGIPLPSMPSEQSPEDKQRFQENNEELYKKLEQANLKIRGLEIMIDIAEQQLGIDIRKKSGTKRSEE